MAGGKQTPRQRMIGILYLVLLGLIALDVPENLLDAFKHISDSLSTSTANVDESINKEFQAFDDLPNKTDRDIKIGTRADSAKKISEELDTYVKSLEKIMIDESGGIDKTTGDYAGRENLDESVDLMVERRKNASKLQEKIKTTKERLLNLFAPKDTVGLKLPLQADEPPKIKGFPYKNWAEANFGEGVPMGAAMTALIKIQADNKNAENIVVTKILSEVGQSAIHLDKFAAVAVAPTSYLLVGQPYTAQVFLTAYDSQLNPKITVDGSPISTEDGKGNYTGSTSTEGFHTWTGTITVTDNNGMQQTYKTQPQTYQVAKPSAVVSPDNMNVLYIGVPNPVSVSSPGVQAEKLNVSISGSGGSITGSAGHYTVMVSSVGKATVTVSGEIAPGRTSVLGSTLFRVKQIPDPIPQFAGVSGGNLNVESIKETQFVVAKLENFDFKASFKVIHFTLLVLYQNGTYQKKEVNGNQLSSEMHTALNTIRPGSIITIRDIDVVGPDGKQRDLQQEITLTATAN